MKELMKDKQRVARSLGSTRNQEVMGLCCNSMSKELSQAEHRKQKISLASQNGETPGREWLVASP